jgi:hypothetical protein
MKLLTIFLLLLSFNSNASYCLLESNDGNLRIDSTSVELCPSGLILLSNAEYQSVVNLIADSELEVITPTKVMTAFTFGFGTYAMFWFLGFKGRTARAAIKQI